MAWLRPGSQHTCSQHMERNQRWGRSWMYSLLKVSPHSWHWQGGCPPGQQNKGPQLVATAFLQSFQEEFALPENPGRRVTQSWNKVLDVSASRVYVISESVFEKHKGYRKANYFFINTTLFLWYVPFIYFFILFYFLINLFIFIEFTGVTLVNKII